jgi:hypothetical protein
MVAITIATTEYPRYLKLQLYGGARRTVVMVCELARETPMNTALRRTIQATPGKIMDSTISRKDKRASFARSPVKKVSSVFRVRGHIGLYRLMGVAHPVSGFH